MIASIRPSVQRALERTAEAKGVETARERLVAMKRQCEFGEQGTCCRICYMGPCRVKDSKGGAKKGVCGLSPDAMVARNLLREAVGGAASHVGHARHLLLTLRAALNGEIPYKIRGRDKVFALAELFELPVEGRSAEEVARDLVAIALEDFGRQDGKLNNWLATRAPAPEIEMWEKLGIAYSNPHNEIETAMYATAMGNDADPVTLLLRTLKLGLVDGWTGLALCTDVQDILFGTPQLTVVEASAGVLRQDSVNIAVHGHDPLLSEKIVEWSMKLEEEAIAAGAKSINVVGVCCTGNELSSRHAVPLAAHNQQSELILATGAVDAMVVDVQCIWPSLPQIAACFDTAFITTDEMVRIPGATHVEFERADAGETARKAIRMAIEAFQKRQGKEVDIPDHRSKAITGLSVEAIADILLKINVADPLKPLIGNIIAGNILGFAGVIGCSNVKFRDRAMTERMVKELLANNVLVLTTGCTAHICAQEGLLTSEATEKYCGEGLKRVLSAIGQAAGLGAPMPPVWHMGSCVDNSRIVDLLAALADRLGVKIGQLPAIGSAPELVQEKALSIGISLLALGTAIHVAPAPRVLGSRLVTQVLTQDLAGITGAKVIVEYDPVKAAAAMVEYIKEKRAGLGMSVCADTLAA